VKLGENNSKAINALLNGLSDMVFTKVAHCKYAKEIWDKLRNNYEGDLKVKTTKLQTYRGQFEQLKMKEDEDITTYSINAILNGLSDMVFTKVAHCKYDKEIWDKLRNNYEGDSKVKTTKLQTYRGQFKQLNMKEDEDIAAYFLQVDETVNAIIGLGEEIEEFVIVQKVLRSLPMRFNPKISTL
jgi:hypothetical protein